MKRLLIFISIFVICLKGFAQDDELYQTWYIDHLNTEVFGIVFSQDVTPDITPTMTFESISDREIKLVGWSGCNEFTVRFSYDADDPIVPFTSLSVNADDNVCSDSIMLWELRLLYVLTPGNIYYPFIQTTPDGLLLLFENPLFESISAYNYELDTQEFKKPEFKVFPNPATNQISWISTDGEFDKIQIFTADGRLLKQINQPTNNQIDVSSLAAGVYFLSLSGDSGNLVKRFVKQ